MGPDRRQGRGARTRYRRRSPGSSGIGPNRGRGRGGRRARGLLATALALALTTATLAQAAAPSPAASAAEAARLSAAIADSARLARTHLAPGASALANELPGVIKKLDSLHQPAATTEEQLSVALGQLQQMSTLTSDPHYVPALTAVGRAYVAASGSDPLTGIVVNPEYAGLGRELAASSAALQRSAARAASLSQEVRSLSASLSSQKRHARRLAAALARLRRATARPQR